MAFNLIIEQEAQLEIEDAIYWYESKQDGLGEEFLDYIGGYFETLITGNPDFEIKRKPVFRELPLKRFPYVIVYEKINNDIIVYSVFNTYQNPIKKLK
ncbi:type II toxin-antitoxin system RelE/ParE family toxin [Aquimarina agarilytica]|uniref:type II toxin-antitoxin system RelE/ParE family toxin n=1 Tax=Aquimarina agarilytica TaxID=1087449 RepID=UPI00028826C1|nr:type II toxin-antitoxin system RelE/ParE family toxin [Aquimarina agarilytica]